ncbi:uncharacterized protein [Gossypium hirsutum]|uniref:Uncharacterized protein n=1 Tax=Gossypium hirsutum TaxID=3635 RepID=A0A1U8ISZ1_GOSHI|nr:uncharacterized protein LOC107899975 [Gossypium hirsutum]
MTLRSGKVLEPVPGMSRAQDSSQNKKNLDIEAAIESAPQKSLAVPPPLPRRLVQCKEQEEKEIFNTFRKVEINIPLLDAIKKIPRYAKFLTTLCTSKRKLLSNEKVSVEENVSTILQRKIPPKCKDQGNRYNYSACRQICSNPEVVLEDVLTKVNGLIFLADFYIINMEDENSASSSDILLWRPFLSTARMKIDVWSGTLTMEFDGDMVRFNVYEDTGHPNDKLQIVPWRNVDLDVKQEELSMIQKPIREAVMEASKLELKLFLECSRIPTEKNSKMNGKAQRHLNPLMLGESAKGFKDSGKWSKPFYKNIQVHKMKILILNKPNV